MKNGLLVWNIVLTVIAGYLLFNQFSKKSTGAVAAGNMRSDSSTGSSFRIAYFEVDSVENNLDMVKDVRAEINKKDEDYSNQLGKLNWTYQKRVQEYQQKSATMTQPEHEKELLELKQLEDRLKGNKQELDNQYQDFVTRRNLKVKKRIEDFLAEYNKEKKYSYIVAYEQGLFYYKDTVYNITNDLIRGLNVEYKNKKE